MFFVALLSVRHDGLGWEKVRHAPGDESNSGKKITSRGTYIFFIHVAQPQYS